MNSVVQHLAGFVARTGRLRLLALLLLPIPLLLLGDLAHHHTDWRAFDYYRWDVEFDRSFIEAVGYAQTVAAAVLLFAVARAWRAPVFLGWGLLLLTIFLDDSLELHERGGLWLSDRVDLPTAGGLLEKDVGELLTWGLLGALLSGVLLVSHVMSSPPSRRASWRLGALLVVLVVFAVGVDMLNVAFQNETSGATALGDYLEAGGELAGLSLLLWQVLLLLRPAEDMASVTTGTAACRDAVD